jgi:histidyl-tRNA synthetase
VIIFGEDEKEKGIVQIKKLATGEQKEVSLQNIATEIQNFK